MPCLTLTENLQLQQLCPDLVASYDIESGDKSGSILGHKTHMLSYLLSPNPHGAHVRQPLMNMSM